MKECHIQDVTIISKVSAIAAEKWLKQTELKVTN